MLTIRIIQHQKNKYNKINNPFSQLLLILSTYKCTILKSVTKYLEMLDINFYNLKNDCIFALSKNRGLVAQLDRAIPTHRDRSFGSSEVVL
jgi:hypothetical protein